MSPISALGARLETDVLAARAGDALAFGRLVDETRAPSRPDGTPVNLWRRKAAQRR